MKIKKRILNRGGYSALLVIPSEWMKQNDYPVEVELEL